jgi:hypothetical protein
MKYNVGDTIRIQSQKWIDAQEKKDVEGSPAIWKDGCESFVKDMFRYAGKIATIMEVDKEHQYYDLNIDDRKYAWEDWMFDPDYKPDEPLSAEGAIRAMLDKEAICDKNGQQCFWNNYAYRFEIEDNGIFRALFDFTGLYRRPIKCKRFMTKEEINAWAESVASHGWMVRNTLTLNAWTFPNYFEYTGTITDYQRAKLLPDLSGIDESTIQGFRVEE